MAHALQLLSPRKCAHVQQTVAWYGILQMIPVSPFFIPRCRWRRTKSIPTSELPGMLTPLSTTNTKFCLSFPMLGSWKYDVAVSLRTGARWLNGRPFRLRDVIIEEQSPPSRFSLCPGDDPNNTSCLFWYCRRLNRYSQLVSSVLRKRWLMGVIAFCLDWSCVILVLAASPRFQIVLISRGTTCFASCESTTTSVGSCAALWRMALTLDELQWTSTTKSFMGDVSGALWSYTHAFLPVRSWCLFACRVPFLKFWV